MAVETRTGSRIPYNPALDGLRALAVLGILCFHADFARASGGFLSVSAFFTLSGFLITRLLLGEWLETGSIALGRFWGRRFRRLMPAALAGLSIVVLARLFGAAPTDPPAFAGDVLASIFYVANWRFIVEGYDYAAIFRDPSSVQHYWSLGIEEQFYIVYPLLVVALLRCGARPKRGVALAIGGLVLLSTALMAALHESGGEILRVYYGTDTRMAEPLIGALLALLLPRDTRIGQMSGSRWLGWVGLPLLAGMLWLWSSTELASNWVYRGGLLAHAVLSASVIAATCVPGPTRTLLAFGPLRRLGQISYGLYIYHWPVFIWLDAEATGLSPAPLFGLRLLVVLGLSIASYRLLEQPIRTGRVPTRRAASIAALSMSSLIAALVWVVALSPPGPDVGQQPDDSDANSKRLAAGGQPTIFVVGDSVARNIGRGLRRWGIDTGRAHVVQRAHPGCAIARGGQRLLRFGPAEDTTDECLDSVLGWRDMIAGLRPEVVVMLTGGFDLVDRKLPDWPDFARPGDSLFDDWLVDEYQRIVDMLSAQGAHVVWLTWPCAKDKEYRSIYAGTGAFGIERVRHLNEEIVPRLLASKSDRMSVVDLFAHVCPSGDFSHALGDFDEARSDGVHFSKDEARWLAEWLGPEILRSAKRE